MKATRLHQVLGFIRQSEAEKSSLEAQYTRLADRVVPFTFGLAGLALLFSQKPGAGGFRPACGLFLRNQLATPLAVLSAMRSGAKHGIAVKGGKYLEAVRKADTLVFDKTGTLTSAKPAVIDIISRSRP